MNYITKQNIKSRNKLLLNIILDLNIKNLIIEENKELNKSNMNINTIINYENLIISKL